jgi:hypothetical protein
MRAFRRYGGRLPALQFNAPLRRNPFALLAVLTLAAGIALFSRCTADRTRPQADESARPAGDAAAREEAAASQPATLRVGAWNIEWLGTPDSRSGPARGHAQSSQDLADYIAFADVSVLALAEIAKSSDGGAWKSEVLGAALAQVGKRTGGDWEHILFPAQSGRNQLVGVAWDRKRVTSVGRPWPLPVAQKQSAAGKPLWSRPPYAQKFSTGPGRTDFVVVALHMKSDTGGDFAEHRGEEAAALVATLASARETMSDADWLFIGDSNCNEHSEPAIAALTSAGFIDLNGSDVATHVRWGALDRAFVPAGQPEFGREFFVIRDEYLAARRMTPEDFKVRLSDHFMVVTVVAGAADDD